jgi:hypothetical protein
VDNKAMKGQFDHFAFRLSAILLVISSLAALGLAEFVFRTVKEMEWRKSADSWQHDLWSMVYVAGQSFGI